MCLPNSSATKVSSVPLPMASSPNICINASSQMSSVSLPDVLEPYNAAFLQVPKKQTEMISPQYTAAADVTPSRRITTQNNDAALQRMAQDDSGHNTGCEAVFIDIPKKISSEAIPRDWTTVFNLFVAAKKAKIRLLSKNYAKCGNGGNRLTSTGSAIHPTKFLSMNAG
uniref:Uncharacterized protein n=1 Tax=Timema cristinae TaxID=61476 RepID=A0A7R9DAV1_TIMCR|nr:unnamed protein product [Timema cristinae]